jgi:hypothetical protein
VAASVHTPKTLREPSKEENFRHGGRSAGDLEVRCCAAVFYVMAEAMTRKTRTNRVVIDWEKKATQGY